MGLDRDAIDHAYQQHGAALLAYCRKRLDDPEDAADVAAGVWEEIIRKADHYEDRGWPLSAWIYRIAQSRCVDHLRRQLRRPAVRLRDDAPLAAPGEAEPIPVDLPAILAALTPPQRQAMLLAAQGLRAPEIAERLMTSEGAVRALLHRARVALRAELDADLAPPRARGGRDRRVSMWYYHDDERWYAVADPRQAPPGARVWRADEVTIAGGQVRAGREEPANDGA